MSPTIYHERQTIAVNRMMGTYKHNLDYLPNFLSHTERRRDGEKEHSPAENRRGPQRKSGSLRFSALSAGEKRFAAPVPPPRLSSQFFCFKNLFWTLMIFGSKKPEQIDNRLSICPGFSMLFSVSHSSTGFGSTLATTIPMTAARQMKPARSPAQPLPVKPSTA